MLVIYGVKNCDSVKKARLWLENSHIEYRFHDYRSDGLDAELLQFFVNRLGLDTVLNQRSASWRQLSAEQKQDLSAEKAMQLMLSTPTLIKRPIVDTGDKLFAGFNPELYATITHE